MKLLNVSNIKFGNNQINNLYLGTDKLWSSNPENKTFDLLPIVMDSDANLRLSYVNSLPTQGNATFIMKPLNGITPADIDIILPYENITSNLLPRIVVNKIDDYALLCTRYNNYNSWQGGTSSGLYEEEITYQYDNGTNVQQKKINYYGRGDENNQTFIAGLYVNKIIKIPSCEYSGYVNVRFFPYTFDDEFYSMTTFKIYLIDYNDTSNNRINKYLWDNTNQTFTHITTGNVINLNDTIFSSFNIVYGGLEGRIEYTINPNTTNNFRDVALCTMDAMVHFIQEPHNEHRIYFGDFHTRNITNGTDKYLDSYNDSNEYLFSLCGSRILNRSIEINFIRWSDFLYPQSLENEYNIIMEGRIDYKYNVSWDNMTYKYYVPYKDSKIIFKKK